MMNYKKLNLTGSSAPHIRVKSGVRRIMCEVILALLPALGFAVFNFGLRALMNTLVSIAGCCAFELLYRAIRKQNVTIGDFSAVLTGMLLAFTCPVTIPYWMLLIGGFIAIVVVKQLPGGLGKNYLNPALAARTALLLLWRGEMTTWVSPRAFAPLWGSVDAVTSPTPLALLRQGGTAGLRELYGLPEMLVGLTGGALGEVSALLLMAGGVFLIGRKIIPWRIPAAFLGTAAALFLLFHGENDPLGWMLCQLMGGGLLLGAFFMATDYVTSPVTHSAQLIYGAGCGALTVLLRCSGVCMEGAGVAILLMNLAARPLERVICPSQFRTGGSRKREEGI